MFITVDLYSSLDIDINKNPWSVVLCIAISINILKNIWLLLYCFQQVNLIRYIWTSIVAEGVKNLCIVMTKRKFCTPLVLSWSEDFENCFQEIQIWQCVTELEKKKQGLVIYCDLLLERKLQKGCEGIHVKALNVDDGVDILTNKRKELYVRDIEQITFMAYQ